MTELVRWFGGVSLEDMPLVGGKNASLGEMFSNLGDLGWGWWFRTASLPPPTPFASS